MQPENASKAEVIYRLLEAHGFMSRSSYVQRHTMARPPRGEEYETVVDPPEVTEWMMASMDTPDSEAVAAHLDRLWGLGPAPESE